MLGGKRVANLVARALYVYSLNPRSAETDEQTHARIIHHLICGLTEGWVGEVKDHEVEAFKQDMVRQLEEFATWGWHDANDPDAEDGYVNGPSLGREELVQERLEKLKYGQV